jgi:acyl transferase domain-containing protein
MECRLGFLASTIEQLVDKLQAYVDGKQNIENMFWGHVSNNKEGIQFINQDNDIQGILLNKWVNGNQFAKLLAAWVKGLNYDWNILYGKNKPHRIELPLYPFAKERYWIKNIIPIPDSDVSTIIHPLLHTNVSNFKQQCYYIKFNGEEFFLKDHRVKIGNESIIQKVLPGVAYLEMTRTAVENAMLITSGSYVLELRNIIWIRPIIVMKEKEVSIVLSVNDDDQIDFEVFSLDDGQKNAHYQGQAIIKKQYALEGVDLESLTKKMRNGHLETSRIYTIFRERGLHYGPAHQGIKIIYQGENQVLAKLHLPEVAKDDRFVLHPSLIDSALQSAIGFTDDLSQSSSQPSLPFALDFLRIFSPCEKIMYSWVRYSNDNKSNSKISKLDIDLMNQNGQICVQMQGFSTRVLNNEIMKNSYYNITFYETIIKDILNNRVSVQEAINLG